MRCSPYFKELTVFRKKTGTIANNWQYRGKRARGITTTTSTLKYLQHDTCCAKCCTIGNLIIPIFRRENKPRHREVKQLASDHTVCRQQSQSLNNYILLGNRCYGNREKEMIFLFIFLKIKTTSSFWKEVFTIHLDLPHSQTYFLSLLGAIGRRGNNRGPIGRRARGGGRKKERGARPALALGRKWSYILKGHLASWWSSDPQCFHCLVCSSPEVSFLV